jgi:hypothetical protein
MLAFLQREIPSEPASASPPPRPANPRVILPRVCHISLTTPSSRNVEWKKKPKSRLSKAPIAKKKKHTHKKTSQPLESVFFMSFFCTVDVSVCFISNLRSSGACFHSAHLVQRRQRTYRVQNGARFGFSLRLLREQQNTNYKHIERNEVDSAI